jgi:hypothetical protein
MSLTMCNQQEFFDIWNKVNFPTDKPNKPVFKIYSLSPGTPTYRAYDFVEAVALWVKVRESFNDDFILGR